MRALTSSGMEAAPAADALLGALLGLSYATQPLLSADYLMVFPAVHRHRYFRLKQRLPEGTLQPLLPVRLPRCVLAGSGRTRLHVPTRGLSFRDGSRGTR